MYTCVYIHTHWSQISSEKQFNNYAIHVYTLLTNLNISSLITYNCSDDVCEFLGFHSRVIEIYVLLAQRSMSLGDWCSCHWLRWCHLPHEQRPQLLGLLTLWIQILPNYVDSLMQRFTKHQTRDSELILLIIRWSKKFACSIQKTPVCYTSSQWLDALIIFVQDVLETVYANTYLTDIMTLEAENCDYFYIYYMF